MGIGLAMFYFWGLGHDSGQIKLAHTPIVDQIQADYVQPEYSGYPTGNPFDFGFTSPLETAPGTPLYGLENLGQPIDAPFFLGYSERPKPIDYKPLDLETVLLLGGGL